jgi:hypothetical protein
MSGIQFNRCAINMGKILKLLDDLERNVKSEISCKVHKNEILATTYICRAGVMDKIIENPSWMRNNLTIRIPTGLFSSNKIKINEAIESITDRILAISSNQNEINRIVENMLSKGKAFYQYEEMIEDDLRIEITK